MNIRTGTLAKAVCCLVAMISGCGEMTGWASRAPLRCRPNIESSLICVLPSTSATSEPESELLWYDAKQLTLEGMGWRESEATYQRLPDRAKGKVTDMVWTLCGNTAGICVRFVTDSKVIGAVWDGGGAMNHMAATGNSGLDLYRRRDGAWEFAGVGRPATSRTTAVVARGLAGEFTEYMLYLPLYHGVSELKIGVSSGAAIAPAPLRKGKPLVFYGTSITQGGCAARAGMCHAAMLGRWLDREVINLGFSGSGKMEPIMADLLVELDPAVYVLECLPNMTTEMVRERIEPFVLRLREARPDTPVLLVDNPVASADGPGNVALQEAYERLLVRGVEGLYRLYGKGQLACRENGTVDGVHPTDLGFLTMAEAYEPVLAEILDGGD